MIIINLYCLIANVDEYSEAPEELKVFLPDHAAVLHPLSMCGFINGGILMSLTLFSFHFGRKENYSTGEKKKKSMMTNISEGSLRENATMYKKMFA